VDKIANREYTSYNEEITDILTEQTLLAVKMFVNDHLNELDFALRHVAPTFLKPDTGILIAIAQSVAEQNLINTAFHEASVPFGLQSQKEIPLKEIKKINHKNWKLIDKYHGQKLSINENKHHPNFSNAIFYAAKYIP
jgi:16S rRNA C1402 N4-methylase RsmH